MAAGWASLVLLAGCGIFNPEPGEPPGGGGPTEYPVLSFPSQVLEALEIAYERRDSVKIKELYDSTYTGQSVDLNDQGVAIQFTYPDEIHHVAVLAARPGLTANLELGGQNTWDRLPSDDPSHPEWAVIQIVGAIYKVEIYDNPDILVAQGEGGTFQEFAFAPTLEATSPTDTLWKIVRWKETGRSDPNP